MKVYCSHILVWWVRLFAVVYTFPAECQIGGTDLATSVSRGVDPYFVESSDTISRYGPWCITRDILQDHDGNFWFATWRGIIEYDGKVFTNHTLKNGLIRFHVVSLFEDKTGVKWFGTARGGLYRYDGKVFTLFTKKDGLPDSTIVCMAEDKAGHIWFGTEEGGASRYDGRSFRNFTTDNGLSSNHVNAIVTDRTGKVWFGTTAGLDCYNGKTVSHLTRSGKAIQRVLSLLQDTAGNMWIGRFDGLTRYDGKSFTDFLSALLTCYIREDSKGNIWLAHSEPNDRHPDLPKQVLYLYDGKSFKPVIAKDGLNDFQVFGNITDREGNTWFGTMQGPCMYNGKTFTYFTRE